MSDDRQGLLRPDDLERSASTTSERSSVRPDLERSASYDGRIVLPLSEAYVHQTYADPSDAKYLRAKLADGSIQSFLDRNNGLLLIAASQVFFAGMNVFAKLLSVPQDPEDAPVSTFQLIFVRMSLTYIFAVIYMIYNKVPDWMFGPPEVRALLLLRSSVGFGGLFSIYYSLQYLPLSDATVLTFLTPCFTLVLGYFFLGESFTRREALAGLVALVGVVFIARPLAFFGPGDDSTTSPDAMRDAAATGVGPHETTEAERLSAVLMSLVGVVGAGGAYVTIRCIGKRAHALISVSMFSLCACIFSLVGLIVTRQAIVVPRGQALVYLITLGFSGFVAQFLLTMGLQREKAGRGSTAMYLQLFFAMFWEKVVFGTTPDLWSLCGIVLILGSTVYVAVTTASPAAAPSSSSSSSSSSAAAAAPGPRSSSAGRTVAGRVAVPAAGELQLLPVNNEEALLDDLLPVHHGRRGDGKDVSP